MALFLQDYETTQIDKRLAIDVVSAGATAAAISPVVCLIDSAIMLKAASTASFSSCVNKILKPYTRLHRNLLMTRPCALVFMVYFGTFATANTMDTIASLSLNLKPTTTNASAETSKFIATAAVSTALTVYKDSRLAQILGGSTHRAIVPTTSYLLFTLRDGMTIFASFTLPGLVAPKLAGLIESETNRLRTAQFALPALLQFATTPVHLLGLDLYNRTGRLGPAARIGRIGRDLRTAVPARMIRIIPAFGVGGVLNTGLRTGMLQRMT